MNNDYHFDIAIGNKSYSLELKSSELKDVPSLIIGGRKYSLTTNNEQFTPIIQEFIRESIKENISSISEIASRLKHLPNVSNVTMREVQVTHHLGVSALLSQEVVEPEILSSIDPPSSIVQPGKGSEMHHMLESWVEQRGFSGTVLVVDHGETILKHGYGKAKIDDDKPIAPETHFPIGSVTKPITSLAVLKLVEEGHFIGPKTKEPILDPSKVKILDFLPESFQPSSEVRDSWKGVTLLDLMNHTSGLPSYPQMGKQIMYAKCQKKYPSLSQKQILEKLKAGEKVDNVPLSPQEVFNLIRQTPIISRGEYHYSNFGYHLLGAIIEQVSDQSYENFMNQFLQEDLGLESTGYVGTDQSDASYAKPILWDPEQSKHVLPNQDEIDHPSEAYSSGGLYSTVNDIHRLTSQLMNGAIISSKAVQQIVLDGKEGVFVKKDPKRERDFRQHFTCTAGWNITSKNWIDSEGKPMQEIWKTGAIGGYGSLLALYPNQNSAIIILSNQPNDIEQMTLDLSNGLSVSDTPASVSHPLSSWAGWYKLPWGSTFSIAQNGSKYVFRDSHPMRTEVELEDSSTKEKIAFPWAGPDGITRTHYIRRSEDHLLLFGPGDQFIGPVELIS